MSCSQKYSPIDGGRPIVKREAGIGPKLIEALRLQSGNIAGIVTKNWRTVQKHIDQNGS